MNTEKFKSYTTDDFVLDEVFREIVQESGSTGHLKELLENLPEKRHEIYLAIKIIRGLHVDKFQQPNQRKKELWLLLLQSQKRRVRFIYFRIAASILFLTAVGTSVFYYTTSERADKMIAAQKPDIDDAVLILANGKSISISAKQSNIRYSTDGSDVIINDTSGVAQPVSAEGPNQLIVPYGKRSYITLSEGTKVWLNSGSKLTFPSVFKGATREVTLEGEALFDVTKNKERPFYIKTDAFKIKVYGTKFNVKAYQQDNDYSIVLVEGKVSMNSNEFLKAPEVFLAPNQKATISKGEEKFEITNVENTEFYTAWVDGYLTFRSEEITVLLKRVSRYYNISIEAELTENIEKVSGKLDLKDDVERVLDGIAFISKTKYEKHGDKYVFINN